MTSRTRDKLIEAARQLFAHKGMENTTMNDIASASDKDRRTIYTYFKNKHEIYDAVLERDSENMVTVLRQVAASDIPAVEKLDKYIKWHFDTSDERRSLYQSFKSIITRDNKRLKAVKELSRKKEEEILSEILEEGLNRGEFDPDNVRLLRVFLVKMLRELDYTEFCHQNSEGDSENNSNCANSLAQFIVKNIAKR